MGSLLRLKDRIRLTMRLLTVALALCLCLVVVSSLESDRAKRPKPAKGKGKSKPKPKPKPPKGKGSGASGGKGSGTPGGKGTITPGGKGTGGNGGKGPGMGSQWQQVWQLLQNLRQTLIALQQSGAGRPGGNGGGSGTPGGKGCEDLVCPEIYTPVCGADGKTYSNGCKACGVQVACDGVPLQWCNLRSNRVNLQTRDGRWRVGDNSPAVLVSGAKWLRQKSDSSATDHLNPWPEGSSGGVPTWEWRKCKPSTVEGALGQEPDCGGRGI